MTPDKAKAALGVLRGGRRFVGDEERPAGMVFVGDMVAAYDEALSVLTEALAERGRDAARPVNDCGRECHMIGGRFIAEDPDCPIHGKGAAP